MARNIVKTLLTAQDKTGPAFASASTNMTKLKTASAGLVTALGPLAAAASVGAVVAIGKHSLDAADRVAKLSDSIGASTEALSQYRHVAQLSGTEFESVATAMKKMQKNISDADDGLSTAKRAFDGINTSIEELQAMKPEDAFELIGDELSKIDDRARRTQIAMNIFGRAGADLLPMFKDGAAGVRAMREEADALGFTLTDGMAQDAAAAKDAMQRLDTSFQGLAQTLAIDLAPEIVTVADGLTSIIKAGRKIDEVSKKFGGLTNMIFPAKKGIDILGMAFGKLTEEEEAAYDAANSYLSLLGRIPKVEDVFQFGAGPVDFDNSVLKDLSVPDALQHESMMQASGDVETLIAWWASLPDAIAKVDLAAKNSTSSMKDLTDTASEMGLIVAEAGEHGAYRMSDAIVDAAMKGELSLLRLGDIARSVFGEIFSGFLQLGVKGLFAAATGGAAAVPMAFMPSPIVGVPGLPMSAANKSGNAGAVTVNGGLNVTIPQSVDFNDPVSKRQVAEDIYEELQVVASLHGPED